MEETSKTYSSLFISDKYVKAANVLEKAKGKIESAKGKIESAKEKIESALHSERARHHNKETHEIVENTPLTDVKAPNMFERAKEEIEAVVETIHQKKESDQDDGQRDKPTKEESQTEKSEVNVSNLIEKAKEKAPDLMEKAKGKIESAIGRHDQKETHGLRDDINENTPINEVKGPNVFERAKEEFEAVVETIHPHKEPVEPVSSSPKDEENGFWCSIGKWLEKICSPKPLDGKRD